MMVIGALDSWDDVKTLEVRVDRLERWYRPSLLLIGPWLRPTCSRRRGLRS